MLDLGDAFGYSDILAGASCPLDLSQDIKTLIDLRDERLAFTPQEIADTVRSTAVSERYLSSGLSVWSECLECLCDA